MALGTLEAILKAPPGAADGAGGNRVFSTAFTTATAATVITTLTATDPAVIPEIGAFVTWISDADCYVRVGDANVDSATTSDWFLPAGVAVDWWHNGKTQTHFSVLQKTTGGTLKRYRSSI